MSVTAVSYALSGQHLGRARVDLLTATLKVALLDSGYTPALSDAWFGDVQFFEAFGTGYTPGGLALSARTFEYEPLLDKSVLRCDPALWEATGWTHHYAVLYAATGSAATSPLLSYVDFGTDVVLTGNPYELSFTDGAYRLGRPA